MRLTTEDIGFFTHRRRNKIPAIAGVYGWFLPLRLRKNPTDLRSLVRKICAYDAGSLGVAKWSSKNCGFRWDPLNIELSRDTAERLAEAPARKWKALETASGTLRDRFQQALFVATIFSRPLYVGLTRNLARRYEEHLAGQGQKNNFHNRFTNYMMELNAALTLEQLLFVCVPLRPSTIDEQDVMTDEHIALLEDMLKVICQPVFDDK
jgi:hypothetical protein